MPSFLSRYFNVPDDGNEHAVCCAFPHHTSIGQPYLEKHPSAHVNTAKKVFQCKVCGAGHNEVSFISTVTGCTYVNAIRLSTAFGNNEDINEWRTFMKENEMVHKVCKELGISDVTLNELHIRSNIEGTIMFPVFMKDKLIDIRTYTPGGNPKIKSRTGAPYGMVIPLDIWQETPKTRTTAICAGEKDMAVARSHGFNAITLTGGETTLPLSPMWFKDRDVVILYDNDEAGRIGANKLASYLLDYANSVKVCTKFHEVCVNDKEDITDFFNKYGGTREQLISYMEATPYYTKQDSINNSTIRLVSLSEATSSKYIGKTVRSNIQVAAISEVQYVLPGTIVGEKTELSGKNDNLRVGELREWTLSDDTVQDVLHLVDNGFTENDINANSKKLLHIPDKESYIRLRRHDKVVVYKAYVTEMFESMNTEANSSIPIEYTAYSIGTRLESGKKYMVTYKLTPHPYKGQQLVMLITNAVGANDSVTDFMVNTETIGLLKQVSELRGTVEERMNLLIQKAKGLIGYNGNDTLIKCIDLAYHTVLMFNFGHFKNVRGYLDTLLVGESRVGKSSTADALRDAYQLGTFTSLAGNSATVPGLIGGSNKTAGGAYQTKAGLIPQNHQGLIIFEEFGKCNSNIVTELTDIRSSNEVRITRISGTLALPAMVRMISLSNVKTQQGEIKSIASYPNGISIVTELVSTAEDIARYDILAVLGDKGNAIIDPFWEPDTPLPKEVLQARVRWVWSRTPDQVEISKEVGNYIIAKANELNEVYNCHIKIFGTEAWKKLSRLSIAVAGYLVSTDDKFVNIIVRTEHVDYAVKMFIELYDNHVFRLREYVANERKYNEIDQEGITSLQMQYIKCPGLLIMLEQEARCSRQSLMAAVGLNNDMYNGLMNPLIQGSFIRLSGNDILPTERFRLGMSRINRNGSLQRLGENHA